MQVVAHTNPFVKSLTGKENVTYNALKNTIETVYNNLSREKCSVVEHLEN